MQMLKKLSREVQVVLGGGVLYLIFSFFDWQQMSIGPVTAGLNEWNGVGVIAALLVVALLAWEAAALFQVKIALGSIAPGLVSLSLALLLLLFTVITFVSHNEARHWPSWLGLVLSIAIAGAALARAKAAGVKLPDLGAMASRADGAQGSGGSMPPPPAPVAEPPAAPLPAEPGETPRWGA